MGSSLSFPDVDLSGKVVVITGGNAGIGYETAKGVAVMGAHTIIACRSEDKAKAAIEQMKQEVSAQFQPDGKDINVEFMKLDLSSFRSTKDFTAAFKEKNLPLHILINNAGILGPPLTMTEDGNESQLQVNHLSHFLLTLELLPILLDTATNTGDCRIVILSSTVHKSGVFDPTNLNAEKNYGRLDFYSNSKLFNVMHGFALQRRLKTKGVTVSSVHPGFVNTELFDKGAADSGMRQGLMKVSFFFMKPMIRDSQKGAATSINCAVNPELNKQEHYYYVDCRPTPPIPASENVEHQEQLWEISVQKVKDWLSPEIFDKWGSRMDAGQQEQSPSTDKAQPVATPTETTQTPVTPPNTETQAPVTPSADETQQTQPAEQTTPKDTNDDHSNGNTTTNKSEDTNKEDTPVPHNADEAESGEPTGTTENVSTTDASANENVVKENDKQ